VRTLVNGVQLWVQEEGNGPPVLLLHGLGTNSDLWSDVVPLLVPRHRVLRLDLRGFGRSDAPADTPYSLGVWARDVQALLEARKASPAIVVGHGLGASVALELALDFPQPARGNVVVSGSASVTPLAAPTVRQHMELAERQGMAAVAALARQTIAAPARADLFERYQQALMLVKPASYARSARALMQADLSERVSDVAKPTLVVVGQQDAVAPVAQSREIEEAVSGARLSVLPGIGHLVPWEAPQELARLVSDFAASAGKF
jgi:3-oxoadipate enol-lactonase